MTDSERVWFCGIRFWGAVLCLMAFTGGAMWCHRDEVTWKLWAGWVWIFTWFNFTWQAILPALRIQQPTKE